MSAHDDAILCQITRAMSIRQSISRSAQIGTCFGLLLAVLVLAYGYLEPYIHFRVNDWLILISCPSSIVLMAADNANRYVIVGADSEVIVINVLWYAFLFEVGAQDTSAP